MWNMKKWWYLCGPPSPFFFFLAWMDPRAFLLFFFFLNSGYMQKVIFCINTNNHTLYAYRIDRWIKIVKSIIFFYYAQQTTLHGLIMIQTKPSILTTFCHLSHVCIDCVCVCVWEKGINGQEWTKCSWFVKCCITLVIHLYSVAYKKTEGIRTQTDTKRESERERGQDIFFFFFT